MEGRNSVQLKNCSVNDLNKLVDIDKLGRWLVKCYIPNREKYKIGVISPVELDDDIGIIQTAIETQYNVANISRLNRKNHNGEWVPSGTLKIVFEEEQLPQNLKIGYSFYKVRPFVNEPLRCFRCQRLGHTALGCNARTRCLLCGGDHLKDQCRTVHEKCANCSGNHRANSKLCSIYKTACDIEQEKALKQTSHEEARRSVIRRNIGSPSTFPRLSNQAQETVPAATMVSNTENATRGNLCSYRDITLSSQSQWRSGRESSHEVIDK